MRDWGPCLRGFTLQTRGAGLFTLHCLLPHRDCWDILGQTLNLTTWRNTRYIAVGRFAVHYIRGSLAMHCPHCDCDTRVVDTSVTDSGVRRRRECSDEECELRFTTYERYERDSLQVLKQDGSQEPFDREKVRRGIEHATRERPIPESEIDQIVSAIEDDLESRDQTVVASDTIGRIVSEYLRERDTVAYLRFVSVYKAFSDAEAFMEELNTLLDQEDLEADLGTDIDAEAVATQSQGGN